MSISRRQLLAGASGLLAGLLVGCRRHGRSREHVAELARELGLDELAPRLGSQYLDAHPEEASAEALLERLVPGGETADVRSLRQALAARIEGDFAAVELVELEGWVLSRTEGQLLALVTLLEHESDGG